jgi:hypothetical protein
MYRLRSFASVLDLEANMDGFGTFWSRKEPMSKFHVKNENV